MAAVPSCGKITYCFFHVYISVKNQCVKHLHKKYFLTGLHHKPGLEEKQCVCGGGDSESQKMFLSNSLLNFFQKSKLLYSVYLFEETYSGPLADPELAV